MYKIFRRANTVFKKTIRNNTNPTFKEADVVTPYTLFKA